MRTIERSERISPRRPDIGAPILEAAIGGDNDARAEVYQFYQNRVGAYFFASQIPRDEIDDCCQNVWENVFRKLPDYKPERPFQFWLFAIASHESTDYYRSLKNKAVVTGEQIEATNPNPFIRPEEAFEIMELYDAIRGQFEVIPPNQAAAVYNHYVMDLNHLDSAHLLATTEDNARQLASRGIGRIRAGLKREGLD